MLPLTRPPVPGTPIATTASTHHRPRRLRDSALGHQPPLIRMQAIQHKNIKPPLHQRTHIAFLRVCRAQDAQRLEQAAVRELVRGLIVRPICGFDADGGDDDWGGGWGGGGREGVIVVVRDGGLGRGEGDVVHGCGEGAEDCLAGDGGRGLRAVREGEGDVPGGLVRLGWGLCCSGGGGCG